MQTIRVPAFCMRTQEVEQLDVMLHSDLDKPTSLVFSKNTLRDELVREISAVLSRHDLELPRGETRIELPETHLDLARESFLPAILVGVLALRGELERHVAERCWVQVVKRSALGTQTAVDPSLLANVDSTNRLVLLAPSASKTVLHENEGIRLMETPDHLVGALLGKDELSLPAYLDFPVYRLPCRGATPHLSSRLVRIVQIIALGCHPALFLAQGTSRSFELSEAVRVLLKLLGSAGHFPDDAWASTLSHAAVIAGSHHCLWKPPSVLPDSRYSVLHHPPLTCCPRESIEAFFQTVQNPHSHGWSRQALAVSSLRLESPNFYELVREAQTSGVALFPVLDPASADGPDPSLPLIGELIDDLRAASEMRRDRKKDRGEALALSARTAMDALPGDGILSPLHRTSTLQVARTIADLELSPQVEARHVREAWRLQPTKDDLEYARRFAR